MDIFARILAVGRADVEDLETLRPGLVASPGARRDADRVPFLELLDELVVDFIRPLPRRDHVNLRSRFASGRTESDIGRDAVVAKVGCLAFERLGRRAEPQIRRAVEPGAEELPDPK